MQWPEENRSMTNEWRPIRFRSLTCTHDAPPRGCVVRVGGLTESGNFITPPSPLLYTFTALLRAVAAPDLPHRAVRHRQCRRLALARAGGRAARPARGGVDVAAAAAPVEADVAAALPLLRARRPRGPRREAHERRLGRRGVASARPVAPRLRQRRQLRRRVAPNLHVRVSAIGGAVATLAKAEPVRHVVPAGHEVEEAVLAAAVVFVDGAPVGFVRELSVP